MSFKIIIPNIIRRAKENGSTHIFFVNSPITTMVTKLIIENYKLDSEKILIVSIRNTKTSILDYLTINLRKNFLDRVIYKLFNYNLYGKRILNSFRTKNKNFIIYSAWFYPEVQDSINSSKCIGHIYLEEGQLSYSSIKPISKKEMSNQNKSTVYKEPHLRKNYFLNTAKAYIGIFPNVFPQISKEKKFILNNHDELLKFYKPRLIGIKNIGLTCAERRIRGNDWRIMIDRLLANMPEGGVIKLHPSFSLSTIKNDSIKKYTELKSNNKVTICSMEIFIEIEMIKEAKNLIGPLTSLKKYALLLESSFQEIKLY